MREHEYEKVPSTLAPEALSLAGVGADPAGATLPGLAGEALSWFTFWPDGLVAVDQAHRVLHLSPKAQELLGWTPDAAQGRGLHELVCARSRDHAHNADDCPLCAAEVDCDQTFSTWWLTQAGRNISVDYRVIRVQGGRAARLISFYDNRARPYSFREMVKYTEYVDQSPTPIAEFDSDGQLLFGNPALQEALLFHGFDDSGSGRIWPANLAALCQSAWQQQKIINDVEVKIDDSWYRWHLHPVASATSQSVMAYLFDITEQKSAQIRLAEEKTAARRDFFAKMVHELRTPLNAIIGFSQVLLRRAENVLEERDMAGLRAIRAAGLQLNEMVSDTLDIAKIEAGKMTVHLENLRLARVLESFGEQVLTLADAKKLSYRVHCDAELVIFSDAKKVRQILLNLVGNAIKYTHSGAVEVRASLGVVGEAHPEEWVLLEVADTGIGINPAQQTQLFRAYEQVTETQNRTIQGTGLGLALVAELVQMLGGRIRVTSAPGAGSVFSVVLPLRGPELP
jgi:two-component system autoinducer 2 sensor kinase/phosphatase LuxQ